MTTPNPNPNPNPKPADWDSLACYSVELRDALLVTGLALRDYQFTLDSSARRAAQHQAVQWIELLQGCEKRNENGQSHRRPFE